MIRVREMTEQDAQTVKDIEIECKLSAWTAADYMLETQREDSVAMVATHGDKTVGFIVARLITIEDPVEQISHPGQIPSLSAVAEIMNIGVLPEFRRKGVATRLLAQLREVTRAGRLRSILLEVRQSNVAAIAFYRRHGFRVTGLRPKFYRGPQEDALIMEKQITYDSRAETPPTAPGRPVENPPT